MDWINWWKKKKVSLSDLMFSLYCVKLRSQSWSVYRAKSHHCKWVWVYKSVIYNNICFFFPFSFPARFSCSSLSVNAAQQVSDQATRFDTKTTVGLVLWCFVWLSCCAPQIRFFFKAGKRYSCTHHHVSLIRCIGPVFNLYTFLIWPHLDIFRFFQIYIRICPGLVGGPFQKTVVVCPNCTIKVL